MKPSGTIHFFELIKQQNKKSENAVAVCPDGKLFVVCITMPDTLCINALSDMTAVGLFSDLKNTCFELCVIMVEHTIVASKNGTNFFLYMSVNAKAGIHINPSPALAQI